MSYNDVAEIARNVDIRERVAACASTEGEVSPVMWAEANMWRVAGSPGWGDAYAYAVSVGNDRPGYDEAVITDGMILAAVQEIRGVTA